MKYDLEIDTYVDQLRMSDSIVADSPVGSHYICGTKDTDYDVLLQFDNSMSFDAICSTLKKTYPDMKLDFTDYTKLRGDFISGKMKTQVTGRLLNFICTPKASFYESFVKAAEVCKNLKLTNKKDRIMVHEIVIYGIGAGSNLFLAQPQAQLPEDNFFMFQQGFQPLPVENLAQPALEQPVRVAAQNWQMDVIEQLQPRALNRLRIRRIVDVVGAAHNRR